MVPKTLTTDTRTFNEADLSLNERIRPIRIAKGSIGQDMLERDLFVSPQHRVLVNSRIAKRMTNEDEVLVSAKHLLRITGIDVANDMDEVMYVHFMFDRHQIVEAEGVLSESLYAGPQAIRSLLPEARAELVELFPELADISVLVQCLRVCCFQVVRVASLCSGKSKTRSPSYSLMLRKGVINTS